MMHPHAAAMVLAASLLAASATTQLVGADFHSNLYRIDVTTGAATRIAPTVPQVGGMSYAPDGTLYAIQHGTLSIYKIDPATGSATRVTNPSGSIFEGGLAMIDNTTAYACNGGSNRAARLFRIDLTANTAQIIGTIGGGSRDVNGLLLRGDGKLIGLDRVTQSLIVIDPTNASATTLARFPSAIGSVGGLAAIGSQAYAATGKNGGGSNSLYRVDLTTGAATLVGSLGVTTFEGICGLATGCSGVIAKYGSGLAGSGQQVPAIESNGCPRLGASLHLQLRRAMGGRPGAFILGSRQSNIPFRGGFVLALPEFAIPFQTTGSGPGNGAAQLPLTIPNNPTLPTQSFFAQSWIDDPGAPQGLSHTSGLQLTIGQ